MEIYKIMAKDTSAASVLCEPVQSKCTWTFHKSHFVWKFTGKMLNATDTTSIEHRALTVTARILSVATLFGERKEHPESPIQKRLCRQETPNSVNSVGG